MLRPGERCRVDVGVRTEFEEGYVALVCDKSGIAFKAGVTTLAGVIDGDFPDTWGVILLNTGKEAYIIRPGDKVAQVLFLRLAPLDVEISDGATFVAKEETRDGGWGSTGTR